MTTETTQAAASTAAAQVAAKPAIVPGSPEYNAAMVAKARGSRAMENGVERTFGPVENPVVETPLATATETAAAVAVATPATTAAAAPAVVKAPDGTPAKFVNADGSLNAVAMAKSYTELERLTSQRQAPPAKTAEQLATEATAEAARVAALTPEQKAAEVAAAAAKVVQKTPEQIAAEAAAVEAAKVPPVTFAQAQAAATAELTKDGKLSDSSYATFEKLGIPKASVDVYIAGQQAQGQVYLNEIYTAGGGKDAYTQMVQWASANLSAEEATAFDGVLRAGDRGAMQMAVAGLKARHAASNGTGGTLVQPAPGEVQTATAAFANQAEMTRAMQDPRYAKDSAYRNEVAAKVASSKRQGISLGINAYANRQ